ncbi:MAG: hypothetical protein M3068_09835 [Gemmatimonadota bacterium]|nr:hypothetical protein [Gemmatimonadota bacterium]
MRSVRLTVRALLLTAAACQFDRSVVPTGQGPLVIHAVLDPAAPYTVVLIERALTGRAIGDTVAPDPDDPIRSSGGIPVSDATVVLRSIPPAAIGPLGECAPARGVEERSVRSDGKGAGVYHVFNSVLIDPFSRFCTGVRVQRGRVYSIEIIDPTGIRVTGRVAVPDASPVPERFAVDSLDRERDSVRLEWRTATGAVRYLLQVQSPFGPFSLFGGGTSALLPGTLRHPLVTGTPPVFLPGFRQTITLGAVDQNFFDYYRSRFDPFAAAGIVNHLIGGSGLFGAFVPFDRRVVEVTKPITRDIEGRYRPSVSVFGGAAEILRLYAYADSGSTLLLSGALQSDTIRSGVLGILREAQVTLAFIRETNAADTLRVFRGTLATGSISGTIASTRSIVFRKEP